MSNGKNVIWLIADQMRADAISINGDANCNTPNLDLLALQGVNFQKAVSGTPLCSPFRGCLFTSQYAHKSSVTGHDYSLDPQQRTITDVFNETGYDTLYFGKWHMDGVNQRQADTDPSMQIVARNRRARFKTWIGYENNNSQFDCYVHGHDGCCVQGDEVEIPPTRLKEFETDALTNLVIDKINAYGNQKQADKNQPFFMVLSVQPPHDPYTAPPEYMKKYNAMQLKLRPNVPPYAAVQSTARREIAGYYALIENIDDNVGRIRDALRKNALDLDTHIVFFSDHGDMHGSHGDFRKTNPYEESIRVPFIIGGEVPMGREGRGCSFSQSLINHVDIAPTTLGLCDIDVPDWMAGYDYSYERLPAFRKAKPHQPQSAYLQSVAPTRHGDSVDKAYRGIVTADGYKYVCFQDNEWLMFQLDTDPYELVNLAHNSVYVDKRIALNQLLREWVTITGDKFKVPEIGYTQQTRDEVSRLEKLKFEAERRETLY